jgi:hypothetical protein
VTDLPDFPREWPRSAVRVASWLWRVGRNSGGPVTITVADLAAKMREKEPISTRSVDGALRLLAEWGVLTNTPTGSRKIARAINMARLQKPERLSAIADIADKPKHAIADVADNELRAVISAELRAFADNELRAILRTLLRTELQTLLRTKDIESDHARIAYAQDYAQATPPQTPPPDSEHPTGAEPAGGGELVSVPEEPGNEPFHAGDAPIPETVEVRRRSPDSKPLPDSVPWSGDLRDSVGTRTAAIWLRAWAHRWGEADADARCRDALAECPAKLAAQCLWHDMAENVRSRTGLLVSLLRGKATPDKPRSRNGAIGSACVPTGPPATISGSSSLRAELRSGIPPSSNMVRMLV